MSDRPTIYLAGPVGHVDDGGAGWRDRVERMFGHEFDFKNPLAKYNVPADDLTIVPGSVSDELHEYGAVGIDDIVESDKAMLGEADAVLVGYEPVRSIGTPMEVMWAYERGYPIALWRRDEPELFEDGALSPWYRYHTGATTQTASSALDALRSAQSDARDRRLRAAVRATRVAEDAVAGVGPRAPVRLARIQLENALDEERGVTP